VYLETQFPLKVQINAGCLAGSHAWSVLGLVMKLNPIETDQNTYAQSLFFLTENCVCL
jgi:hypothetical protein